MTRLFPIHHTEIFPETPFVCCTRICARRQRRRRRRLRRRENDDDDFFLGIGGFGVGPEDYSYSNNDASAGGETVGGFPKFASPSVNDDVNVNEDDDETNLMLLEREKSKDYAKRTQK